jgi:hypothetical protein
MSEVHFSRLFFMMRTGQRQVVGNLGTIVRDSTAATAAKRQRYAAGLESLTLLVVAMKEQHRPPFLPLPR